jgi:ribosomal protein L6P/L9E
MSRIGKKPIVIPAGVDVKLDGTTITVKGPKGTLTRELHPNMIVEIEGAEINVSRPNDNKENRSLHGLTRTLINNMVTGVTTGYSKTLEVEGGDGIYYPYTNGNGYKGYIKKGEGYTVLSNGKMDIHSMKPLYQKYAKGILCSIKF